MLLKLQPLDTLFFRDGKPFNRGEETLATGVFPPYPSTVYGALRTAYIIQNGDIKGFIDESMKDKIGTVEGYKESEFRVRSICLEKNSVKYFPLPLDMGLLSDDKTKGAILGKLENENGLYYSNSDKVKGLIGTEDRDIIKPEQGEYFIPETCFRYYFLGTKQGYRILHINDLLDAEPKVGIKRERNTHVSAEGALYRVNMNRLKGDAAIDVEVDGIKRDELTYILKLGGEGKGVFIADNQDPFIQSRYRIDTIIDEIKERKRFKVYFLTPAIFRQGWEPCFDEVNNITLIGAVIGRPCLIGGWDMAKKIPKPMYKAMPAGSVFYYESDDDNIEDAVRKIHSRNHGERREEGFGYAIVTMEQGETHE